MTISKKKQKLDLLKFISMLFGRCNGGYVEIRPFDLNYNIDFDNRSWLPVENKRKIAKRIWNLRHGHLFYGVATRTLEGKRKKKGSKQYLREIPALFADLDAKDYGSWEDMKEIILDFPFEPSCVIFSGHGLHVYYFLDPPVGVKGNIDRIERILRIIQDKMLKADLTCDVARVLRSVSSINVKIPEKPQLTKILQLKDITYSIEDFEDQFWEIIEKSESKKSNSLNQIGKERINQKELNVSPRIKKLIKKGKTPGDDYKSRSELDMAVICALLQTGYGENSIIKIFKQNPEGVGEKYKDKGLWGDKYLSHSIKSAIEFLSSKVEQEEGSK